MTTKGEAQRWLLSLVPAEGCIEWPFNRNRRGYGQVSYKGRWTLAHRAVWTMHNGPIPPGLCVLHHCDNPPCVNTEGAAGREAEPQ